MSTLLLELAAAATPSPTKTPTGGEGVKSGPWGLAIILLLCIAAYFLFKSMSKHLKRVREDFPGQPGAAPDRPGAPDRPAAPPQGAPRAQVRPSATTPSGPDERPAPPPPDGP